MPTITQMIRDELRAGLNPTAILAHARNLSPNPAAWTLRSIERISRELGHDSITVEMQAQQTMENKFNSWIKTAKASQPSIFDQLPTSARFGVEIEFIFPLNINYATIVEKLRQQQINVTHENYNHDTKAYWKLITDGSVTGELGFRGGNELVSPILVGPAGLKQVITVCKTLKELGCKTNHTCGIHIHHDIRSYNNTLDVIKNTFSLYRKYQNYFKKMMPKFRDRNRYSRPINSNILNTISNVSLDNVRYLNFSRYHHINVRSYIKYGTLEFRQHHGTLNGENIVHWIIITEAIINKAAKNPTFQSFYKEFNFHPKIKTYIKERIALRKAA